jgi:hypothetical protein
MTQEEEQRAKQMHDRMLNQYGTGKLADLGIFKKLVLSLSADDISNLVSNKIFFNPIFSPASCNKINLGLEQGSNIITIRYFS